MESAEGIPDILFLVLHESGVIIYTYPELGREQYIISSLLSATIALGEQISRGGEVAKMNIGDRVIITIKEDDIIYSLVLSREIEGLDKLLFSLVEIVKKDFPAEIVDGIVRSRDDTLGLTEQIESTINLFIRAIRLEKKEHIEVGLPFTDVYRIIGGNKLTKIFRCLVANKNIIVVGYDPISISKVLHVIPSIWPRQIEVIMAEEKMDISKIAPKDVPIVVICKRGMEKEIAEKIGNVTIIDFDVAHKKYKRDLISKKLEDALKLESEESKFLSIRNELHSLTSIIDDIRKILSESKGEITMEELKKKLEKNHPPEKIDYVLRVIEEEKSELLSRIKTPGKVLEEIFF